MATTSYSPPNRWWRGSTAVTSPESRPVGPGKLDWVNAHYIKQDDDSRLASWLVERLGQGD